MEEHRAEDLRTFATQAVDCRELPALQTGGSVQAAHTIANRIAEAAGLLLAFRFDLVPDELGNQLLGPLRYAAELMRTDQNADHVRSELMSHVNDIEGAVWKIVPMAFALEYNNAQENQVSAVEMASTNIQRELEERLEAVTKLKADAEASQAAMEKMVTDAQELLANATVQRHAQHFESEAKTHRNASWAWLGAAVLFALCIVYLLAGWIDQMPDLTGVEPELRSTYILRFTVMRIVALSLVTFGMTFCAKHSSVNRHNYIVNRHRRNSLETFHALVDSTKDPAVKDAVLLHAAQAIYQPQSTGFGGKGGDTPNPPSVEILNLLRGKG